MINKLIKLHGNFALKSKPLNDAKEAVEVAMRLAEFNKGKMI